MNQLGWVKSLYCDTCLADYEHWAYLTTIEEDIGGLPNTLSDALLPLINEVPTQDVEKCLGDSERYVRNKLFPG